MSERGLVVSEIVSRLVADARRQEGLTMGELAERAGVPPTYLGLLERRSRQPTLAVAASLAEAMGLRLSELVAEAEQDVGLGPEADGEADAEPPPEPPGRHVDRAHLGPCPRLEAVTGLTGETVARGVELAYRRLDLLDEQIRESGAPPFVALVELADLSSLLRNVLSAGLAEASDDFYVKTGPDDEEHSPSLLPLPHGLPELDVEVALETSLPTSGPRKAGIYLAFRYVLAQRDGTYIRGKEARGDTLAVWEARFGELGVGDFGGRQTDNGSARLRKEALERMELVYYDPALLPYAKATGVYAQPSEADQGRD